MIRTTNVRGGFIDLSSVRYVDEPTYQRWTRRQVPRRGDIVLTREAPLGDVGLIREDEGVFLGQRLVSYRANPKLLDNRYLLYTLLGPDLQAQIQALGSGATVEHMRVPDAKKLMIPSPPLEVQQRIGSILGAYDDLIEVNRRRIALLEEMARRLFEEWFVHFRFPGHEDHAMVETPDGLLPEGWLVGPFSLIGEKIGESVSPQLAPQTVFHHFSFPAFDAGQLPIRERGSEIMSNKLAFEEPCILLGRLNPRIPRIWYVPTMGELPSIASTEFIPLKPIGATPLSVLYAFATSNRVAQKLRSQSQGTSTSHQRVRPNDVLSISLSIPPPGIVKQAGSHLSPFYDQVAVLRRANASLVKVRDLLLPRLISGELSVATAERELEAVA
jgi:type I restriction enzyme S subunit